MKRKGKRQNAARKHRIFLVEDHPVTQQGFSMLINLESELTVCGRATTAAAALQEIAAVKPDLVVVDIVLPGRDGLELIKDLTIFHPQMPTIVLSTLDETLYAERALRAGAKGYVMKQEPVAKLLSALHHVLAGDVYLSETMRGQLFQRSISKSSHNGATGVDGLSDRELELFRMIGEGIGTRQIAKNLGLSISTVETHRTHIKEKLGANRAPDLVRLAVEWLHTQNFKS